MRPWMYVVIALPFASGCVVALAGAARRRTGWAERLGLIVAALMCGSIAGLGVLMAIQ